MERKHTAYHEAGHAVAHLRLGILQDKATIQPHANNLGAVTAEGVEHVWDAEDAHKQLLGYCAGYAALVAAGYSNDDARSGADDDMENAAELVRKWPSIGTLDEGQRQAVTLMSSAENIRAVDYVARALMKHETLEADYMINLVGWADGDMTDEEWLDFIAWRYPEMPFNPEA
ncbi:MAG: hypothetical protein JSU65_04410 [Candidatus Zixiibacteriota bacterium]|nr:MAG: hypothetical protein JSU65_04410 [candidate division Zixibacteria bacterium]